MTLVAPAPPYVVIADRDRPDEPLGFVHRSEAAPVVRYAFDPTEAGADALNRLQTLVGRLGFGELPRVTCDEQGAPLTDSDGALVLDGVISEDDPDPIAWLRSLAAFADALFSTSLVED